MYTYTYNSNLYYIYHYISKYFLKLNTTILTSSIIFFICLNKKKIGKIKIIIIIIIMIFEIDLNIYFIYINKFFLYK
jgi:hypothetical protein